MENWRIRMSDTAFPINDLLRRRLQTGLTVLSLTTCVASTLFLLLFSGQIGLGIASVAQDTLTMGVSNVFAQFLTFVGILIFVVGAVIVSFIVFLMMAQRTKDYGLMKATGCPNGLVFGYFFTELLGVTFLGCLLGVAVGFAADYAVINTGMFQVYNQAPNFWFAPLVFAVFFVFALIFGAKPMFEAARVSPIKALSPVQYFGISKETKLKTLSKTGLTLRIASRSLFRRKSATIRIVLFLSVVFLLLTVSIAGGIIANDTTTSWLQKATGTNTIMVAESNMATQYTQLLLSFSGTTVNTNFNYSEPQLAVPNALIEELNQASNIAKVDSRLVWYGTIQEQSGFTVDPDTLATVSLGDHRQCDSLIVGIDANNLVSEPFTKGFFLNGTSNLQAVIGDSIAQTIYIPITTRSSLGTRTISSDPLRQGVILQGVIFKISGVCIDPVNNGNVTYLPLSQLENITGLSPNIVLLGVSSSAEYSTTFSQVQALLAKDYPGFVAVDLNQVLNENSNFLGSLWNVVMFLPAFALAAAAICLISYLMLGIDEQHQEFAILRATGAKPQTVISILAVQSLTVLLVSLGVGASLGTIVCILILMANPVVSAFTVLAIVGWLFAALLGMFLLSLYPAIKFARKPLLKIMS
jgi:ABC-type antimicrobial peptide transport system permease subunit